MKVTFFKLFLEFGQEGYLCDMAGARSPRYSTNHIRCSSTVTWYPFDILIYRDLGRGSPINSSPAGGSYPAPDTKAVTVSHWLFNIRFFLFLSPNRNRSFGRYLINRPYSLASRSGFRFYCVWINHRTDALSPDVVFFPSPLWPCQHRFSNFPRSG